MKAISVYAVTPITVVIIAAFLKPILSTIFPAGLPPKRIDITFSFTLADWRSADTYNFEHFIICKTRYNKTSSRVTVKFNTQQFKYR